VATHKGYTLKPRYKDPFNNKILAIKNFILSLSVVSSIVTSPCNNKTPVIKNKIFGPFRFVILVYIVVRHGRRMAGAWQA
jgi:hypothetical protein